MYRFAFMVMLLSPGLLLAQPKGEADDSDESQKLEGKVFLCFDTGGHTGDVVDVYFIRDGKELVSVSTDMSVRIWDVHQRRTRKVLRLPLRFQFHGSALSSDGRTLAVAGWVGVGGERHVLLIDLEKETVTKALPLAEDAGKDQISAGVGRMAFSPDGKYLAVQRGRIAVHLFEIASGKLIRTIENSSKKALHQGHGLAFSPDSKLLAVGRNHKEGLVVYAADTGKPIYTHETGEVTQIAWLDKDRLLVSTVNDITEMDVTKHEAKKPLDLAGTESFVLGGSNRSEMLRTGGPADKDRGLELYDITRTDSPLKPTWQAEFKDARDKELNDEAGHAVALSPDGKFAACSLVESCSIAFFHLKGKEKGKLAFRLGGQARELEHVGWHSDGTKILFGGRGQSDRAFDVVNLAWVKDFKADDFRGPLLSLGGLAFDPAKRSLSRDGKEIKFDSQISCRAGTLLKDNQLVLSVHLGIGLVVNSTVDGKITQKFRHDLLGGHRGAVNALAASPDQTRFATVGRDMVFCLWDPKDTKPLLSFFCSGEDWVIWTPQGYYAATPGGERHIGWIVMPDQPDRLAAYYPADRFQKVFNRPDVVKLVLGSGSVEAALKERKVTAVAVDQVLPPSAKIVEVKITDVTVNKEKEHRATVKVLAESKGQPIKGLKLLLDGRSFQDGKFTDADLKKDTWADVPIPPGKHELKVLVRGPDSSDVSEPYKVITDMPEDQKPVMYIVSVGVNKYRDEKLNLRCAENDARDVLQSFKDANADKLHRFRAVMGEPILSEKATAKKVIEELTAAQKKARPGDLVVFFFAGHGVRDKLKGQPEFFLLTHEADTKNYGDTALAASKLREALKDMPCQVLLILDACHSAGGFQNFVPITDDVTRSMTDDEAAVTVLAAAMPHETAGELEGNGRLTSALKKVLVAKDGVPYDPYDNVMHIFHIYSRVYDEVRNASNGKQNPMLLTPWTSPPVIVRNFAEVK